MSRGCKRIRKDNGKVGGREGVKVIIISGSLIANCPNPFESS